MITERMQQALDAAPKTDVTGRSIERCDPNDPVILPRCPDGKEFSYSMGPVWQPSINTLTGAAMKPTIRCRCGKWTSIGLHHVHADGRVMASYFDATKEQHPDGQKHACGWHVFIKLADYDQGEFKPGER